MSTDLLVRGDAARPASPSAPVRPSADRRLRFPSGLWWISPLGSLLIVVPLSLWASLDLSDAEFRANWRTPKALTSGGALLVAAAAAVLLLGALAAQWGLRRQAPGPWASLSGVALDRLSRCSDVVFWLTMVGYLAFGVFGTLRGLTPGVLVRAIVSQDNYTDTIKTALATVPGVTTLTQCGIAYVVLAAVLVAHGRRHHVRRRLALVLVLALLRAFLNTERLALLELIVPLFAVLAMSMRRGPRPALRRAMASAPLVLLPLVVVIFGAFEYSRSWRFFEHRVTESFPRFVITRLAGYYATSYNNGQLRMEHARFAGRLPNESLQALWTAPGISQLGVYDKLSAPVPLPASDIYAQYGSPEFNNPGGFTVPMVDFGVAGGLLFFLLAGVAVGLFYRWFVEGRLRGLLVYPVLLTGLFELPRYVYWSQGRLLPAVVALVASAYYARYGRLRLPRPRRRQGSPV